MPMSNYCFRCDHFHDGPCARYLRPVYRVRAWRKPDEDDASMPVRLERRMKLRRDWLPSSQPQAMA
jgi:hypothetical protein